MKLMKGSFYCCFFFEPVSCKIHLMEFRGVLQLFSKRSDVSSSLLRKIYSQNPNKSSLWKKQHLCWGHLSVNKNVKVNQEGIWNCGKNTTWLLLKTEFSKLLKYIFCLFNYSFPSENGIHFFMFPKNLKCISNLSVRRFLPLVTKCRKYSFHLR